MTSLAWWLLLTCLVLAGFLIWVFVPILVPVMLVLAGFGAIVPLIVGLARKLERARGVPLAHGDEPNPGVRPRAHRRSDLPD